MGNHSDAAGAASDAVSLHTNPGQSFPNDYDHQDAPELDIDGIDDLPPLYSDAVSSGDLDEPLLPASNSTSQEPLLLCQPFQKDCNSGAAYYVDQRLESPKVLEQHLRHWAATPPRPYIKIVGTHSQTEKRSDNKSETKTITDFDVAIEMTPYLYSNAQYRKSWSQLRTVDNGERARRGTILKKCAPGAMQHIEVGGAPKPTLEEWCHRFCANHGGLKCFSLRREMTGFDFASVQQKLIKLVRDTNYRGQLSIYMQTRDGLVEVYNDAHINRWRLTSWIRWVFYLTLLFLFSWPYLWLRTKRFEVAVAEWPFSRMAAGSGAGAGASSLGSSNSSGREYFSISEDQWYNLWARAVLRAVMEKRQTVLDQADLRRAYEPQPSFESGNATVDSAVGFVQAGIGAMNEVNRHLGWGADC
ncbi:uncharacterized protein PG986_002528 [Apiospora aurea]|uniref:Uncharacterized protein n=1 Tax=Apiospora aurea TaxID=335848 RepID=A0ABR1QP39_9PEZI